MSKINPTIAQLDGQDAPGSAKSFAKVGRKSLPISLAIGLSVGFAYQHWSNDGVLGSTLDTPGKVFLAERAFGIRDGLTELGVDVTGFDARFKPIEHDRNAEMAMTLYPIYEDGYEKALAGAYEEADLDAYLVAIETDQALLRQQSRIVTEAHWEVAREEPIMAALVHDLDTIDTHIYEAMWTMRAQAEEIGGPGRGEAIFDLMMMEVAHDDLREAFSRDTGEKAWSEGVAESFQGFLKATSIIPAESDVVEFYETVPQPVAVLTLKTEFAASIELASARFDF